MKEVTSKRVLVTGGCGFVGGHLVALLLEGGHEVLVVDALTYAGDGSLLGKFGGFGAFDFVRGDVADAALMAEVMGNFRPEWVFHLAAETHVDRSITGPLDFVRTNVLGTAAMLQAARGLQVEGFRFIHVSTDEVYGSLGEEGCFAEESGYAPRSPYSASKAGADHLARAWGVTYGLPVLVTHCGNNYGPGQHVEKLIPLVISRAIAGEKIPVYGDGRQVRDWISAEDHARALVSIAARGSVGETYDIGARDEWRNIDLVRKICGVMDGLRPLANGGRHEDLIRLVGDRPGHDFRYAVDPAKVEATTGWRAERRLEEDLPELVRCYVSGRESR